MYAVMLAIAVVVSASVACIDEDSGTALEVSPKAEITPTVKVSPTLQPIKYVAISAGYEHTCALNEDGAAICWGANDYGQATPPQNERFVSISAGYEHTCAIKEDSTAACWGSNHYGQATPPEDKRFTEISSGVFHTCGIQGNGIVVCWGFSEYSVSSPPADMKFIAISSGWNHSCGLTEEGDTKCWGINFPSDRVPFPMERVAVMPENQRLTTISIGMSGDFMCGLKNDGVPICWDRFPDEPLEDKWGIAANVLRRVPYDERFQSISSGRSHVCALRKDGAPVCWGESRIIDSTPSDETFVEIATGGFHTCALRSDGSIACWGVNNLGQLTPPEVASPTPTPPSEGYCQKGMVVPKMSGCVLPKPGTDHIYRIAVTQGGTAVTYNRYGEKLEFESDDSISTGFVVENGDAKTYMLMAHANDDGSWTIEVAGWEGEDWTDADLVQP